MIKRLAATMSVIDSLTKSTSIMKTISVTNSKKVFPTGDPNFSVKQAFPANLDHSDIDPFLMLDHFGPKVSTGVETHPDSFPVDWHPHRGMDIMTYLVQGVGRHADSLGNRGSYATPGMQWISVGSGIEHAEGGGDPEGTIQMGFQIWINVPKAHKMDDPRYGTEPPENLPLLTYSGVQIRVLAGSLGEAIGPFNTVQPVQILDIIMEPNMDYSHEIPIELNNVLIYIYRGDGIIAGETVPSYHLIHLDGSDPSKRQITFTSNENGASMLLFAGKRLNEPIAWRGPFVMNTWEEINSTIQEYRNGTFLKKRAPWDYKTLSAFPKDKLPIE